MSGKQHVDAKLKGYSYPIFPFGIGRLNEFFNWSSNNGSKLDKIGKSVGSYIGQSRPTSSDGYCWFWALKFRLPAGKRVLVAFPWLTDRGESNNLRLDRSIAVYTYGNVSTEEIDTLIEKLTKELHRGVIYR